MKRIPTKLSIIISTIAYVTHAALMFVAGFLLLLIIGYTNANNAFFSFVPSIFSVEELAQLTLYASIPTAAVTVWVGVLIAVFCTVRLGKLYKTADRPMDFFREKRGQRLVYYVYMTAYAVDVLIGTVTALSVNGGIGRGGNIMCIFLLIGVAVIVVCALVMVSDAGKAVSKFNALSAEEQRRVCLPVGKRAEKERQKELKRLEKIRSKQQAKAQKNNGR